MSSQVSQLLQQSERKNRNTIFELLLKSEITSPLMVFLLCRKSHLQNSGCFPTEMVMTGSWITVLGLRLVADKTSVKNWWFVFCPKRFSVWLMAWDHYQPPSVSLHKPNVQTQNYAKTQIHKFTLCWYCCNKRQKKLQSGRSFSYCCKLSLSYFYFLKV